MGPKRAGKARQVLPIGWGSDLRERLAGKQPKPRHGAGGGGEQHPNSEKVIIASSFSTNCLRVVVGGISQLKRGRG